MSQRTPTEEMGRNIMDWYRFRKRLKRIARKDKDPPKPKFISRSTRVVIARAPHFWFEPPKYKSPFESGRAFVYFLNKKGFKTIGSGCFSTVLAKKDSKRVIKVGRGADTWGDYAIWGMKKGYAGKFTPRVHSYKYFEKAKEPFYVAIVDRYYNCDHEKHEMPFIPSMMGWAFNCKKCKAMEVLEPIIPGITLFGKDFMQNFANDNRNFDLHGGNFMLSSEGNIIMNDPITCHGKVIKTRHRTKELLVAA